ncbi:hypothetical protein [Terrihabitans rhizophilus]|uniref:Uncharacterized protein n=1 Tax=Terrihabitans rhizophilus TaxID=3092662 RepID=A0ABU4RNK9_9HYPH|nr:hypothetical protein [Terrihabitans sp. PJ23]MDX6806442.1 hypothetical protein [Terrihabitans sp. PJ23]
MSCDDTPEFKKDEIPKVETTAIAQAEQAFFDSPKPPNTFELRFGKFGHISWHSDNSTAVLALIVLVLLCVVVLIVSIVGAWTTDKGWLDSILRILGNAISAVAGAVVGASAGATSTRRRK